MSGCSWLSLKGGGECRKSTRWSSKNLWDFISLKRITIDCLQRLTMPWNLGKSVWYKDKLGFLFKRLESKSSWDKVLPWKFRRGSGVLLAVRSSINLRISSPRSKLYKGSLKQDLKPKKNAQLSSRNSSRATGFTTSISDSWR